MRRKTCCALRPSINRRSPFFDPTSKTIAIVRLHESHVWHTFLRSNYAPHCTETVIAQVYDLTVALRNNYIPLTQLLLRKLTRPFLLEGGGWRARLAIYISAILLLLLLLLLYLSAHVQRTKQALGIAPHETLFKKKKHTPESLLRHYKKLLTVTQISSSTSF